MIDEPDDQLNVPLTPLENDHERFPDEIKIFCSASIPSFYFQKLIQALKDAKESQIGS